MNPAPNRPPGEDGREFSGLGFLPTVATAARQTFALLLRNRLLWLLFAAEVLLGVVAFGLAGYPRVRLDGRELFCVFAWWFHAGVVLPWATLYLAVQAVHGDIEDRTFQYLFLRPVGRAPLLLGKWLAVVVVAAVLVLFGGTTLFLGIAAHPDIWAGHVDPGLWRAFCELLCLGAVAYAAVGALLAAAFRRPLFLAALFAIAQMVVALMPVSAGVRSLTVSDPLRRLLLDRIEPGQRLQQMLWPGERDFRSELIGQPLVAIAVLTGIMLLLAMASYCRSEYDSRPRE